MQSNCRKPWSKYALLTQLENFLARMGIGDTTSGPRSLSTEVTRNTRCSGNQRVIGTKDIVFGEVWVVVCCRALEVGAPTDWALASLWRYLLLLWKGRQGGNPTWLTTRWRWMVEDCSACTLMMSLPALAKSATLSSGSTIILQSPQPCIRLSACSCTKKDKACQKHQRTTTWHACAEETLWWHRGWMRWQRMHQGGCKRWEAHRCVSRGASVSGLRASTTKGPIVMSA